MGAFPLSPISIYLPKWKLWAIQGKECFCSRLALLQSYFKVTLRDAYTHLEKDKAAQTGKTISKERKEMSLFYISYSGIQEFISEAIEMYSDTLFYSSAWQFFHLQLLLLLK